MQFGSNRFHKIGSIGKSLPSVEAKLVDINEEGIGELLVKGPSVMLGYYNNKKATNEVFEDGWFYTGDLAKIDEEGYIFICRKEKECYRFEEWKKYFPRRNRKFS